MAKQKITPVDEARTLIEQVDQLQNEVNTLKEQNKTLDKQIKEAEGKLEAYKPYESWITEEVPTVWQIELKDKNRIGALRRLEAKIYGATNTDVVKVEQENISSIRADRINKLVEKMIWYITNNPSRTLDFIRKCVRQPEE